MSRNRRELLQLAAGGLATAFLPKAIRGDGGASPRFAAAAFDAFPVFDPRPTAALAESLFPGQGTALVTAWRTRQFEYQWLRSLGGRYADFWQTTESSLVFAARTLKLDLGPERRAALMDTYTNLKAWPDARASLAALKAAGVKLAFLSNMTAKMLHDGIRTAGLEGLFDRVLSTDDIKTYKPDPRAYRLAVESLGLPKGEIVFVPFAGWDAAGAKWFGYPTFWINRLEAPPEQLDAPPDGIGKDLSALVRFVGPEKNLSEG